MSSGFPSSSRSSRASQTPPLLSDHNSVSTPILAPTHILHPSSQQATSPVRINQGQSIKERRSIGPNSSLPRAVKPRSSISGGTSTIVGIESSPNSGPGSVRRKGSQNTYGSAERVTQTEDSINHNQIPVGSRYSAKSNVNLEAGRLDSDKDGGGSPRRKNATQMSSSIKTLSPSPTESVAQTIEKSRKAERLVGPPSPDRTHTRSTESSKTNSSTNLSQMANRQKSESPGVIQRSNSFSKPNKNKTNLLWRLRSPSKVKDSASRIRDRDQSGTPTVGILKSPSWSITSANRTKTSNKASSNKASIGPDEVSPAVSQNRRSNSIPLSVLRSKSTMDRSKSSGFTGNNTERKKAEGEEEIRGMSRSWSTDLPTATRKIVSNGLVLPSVKYPVHIASPLPSPLPLVPDQYNGLWTENHDNSVDAKKTDSDSKTSASVALATTTTAPTSTASQSSSRAPKISATFGSRANGADLPIPIFLNGIPRTNYSRPIHHRSLSQQSTDSSLYSSSSAAVLAATGAIPEFTTNNYGNRQNGSKRDSTLLPSMINSTVLAGSRHRRSSIRSNSSFDIPKPVSIPDHTDDTSITRFLPSSRTSPRYSSSSKHSSISNSSATSLSVKDSNGEQSNSNYSTGRFLRFSDLFPSPPNHPPFVQARSNRGENSVPISTPTTVKEDLSDTWSEIKPEATRSETERKSPDLTDSAAKDRNLEETLRSDKKDESISIDKDKPIEWSDLGGGLYVCVSCVKHGHSGETSKDDFRNLSEKGVEDDDEEEEIVWKVIIKKKRPNRPLDSNPSTDQISCRGSERRNDIGPSPSLSTNTTMSTTTSASCKNSGSNAVITTPGQALTRRTMTNNLYSVSPLHPTEAISPSTNNTLSLTLSLSPSAFSTTSGRLTFLPIPSLVPPSPTKEVFSLFKSPTSLLPTSLASLASSTGAWSREQIDGKHRRSPGKNHTRTISEFGQVWSAKSPTKRPISLSHGRTRSDVGIGVGKGLSASPKHYSLKDLVGGSGKKVRN